MMRVLDTRRRLRGEDGFTLAELLVAMSLGIIVLFGILSVFDSFTSNAARQTRITDANEQVRATMDRIVSDLRQAQTIEVADPNDLVYTVSDAATQIRRERICLDAAGRLWRTSITTATAPPPLGSGTSCPASGGATAPITSLRSANSAANPLFTYDAPSPADVRSIGLTFALNAGNHGRRDIISTLRAGSFVRARSETALPAGPGDIETTCSNSGIATLTLSAGVGPLNVSYTDVDGNALGAGAAGSAVVLPSGTTTVVANITSSSGALSQLLKTLAC